MFCLCVVFYPNPPGPGARDEDHTDYPNLNDNTSKHITSATHSSEGILLSSVPVHLSGIDHDHVNPNGIGSVVVSEILIPTLRGRGRGTMQTSCKTNTFTC